jgi:ParB family transcriptional regulator, chromosome partitioning protein
MSNVEDKQRNRLGKGLSALLPSRPVTPPLASAAQAAATALAAVPAPAPKNVLPVSSIQPNAEQPRAEFDHAKLTELAASIEAHGIIQPIIVRKFKDGYQIVAGERRWRAAQLAGLSEVPVVIQEITDENLLEIALIENIQREDLNPIETAQAFDRLSKMGFSQEEIGRRTGKDRATIANLIRLLRLPKAVQDLVAGGRLSMGHARALLSLQHGQEQLDLAQVAVDKGLSVRQVEQQAQILLGDKEPAKPKKEVHVDPNVKAAIESLERALGTRVKIIASPSGQRGRIEIEYYSQAELDRLYGMLAGDK